MGAREGTEYLVRKIAGAVSLRLRPNPDGRSALSRRQEAFARYIPLPYPGRVVLILAHEETAGYSSDPVSDWRRLGTAGVDVLELPGNHDPILAEPHVRELADRLRKLLLVPGPQDQEPLTQ
jgi:thioesterase domain-containing protein